MANLRDDELVLMHHAETNAWFECPAAAVEAWRARGWEVADPGERPAGPNPVVEELAAFQAEQYKAAEEAPKPEQAADEAPPTNRRTSRAASASQED